MFEELGMEEAAEVAGVSYTGLPRHFGYRKDETTTGNGGVEIKNRIPKETSQLFVVPFGNLDNPKAYALDGKYIGGDIPAINDMTMWLNVNDLSTEGRDALHIGENQKVLTRRFLCSGVGTDNSFYRDLGYASNRQEGKNLIDSRQVTADSWARVYKSGNFYDSNVVAPTAWHNLPLIALEVEGTGKNRTYVMKELVWLRINTSQFQSFVDCWDGVEEGDNPSIQYRVVKISNNYGSKNVKPADIYTYSRVDITLPEDTHEEIDEYYTVIVEAITEFYKSLLDNQHGGVAPSAANPANDKKSNDAVRDYLVSISVANDWAEFVEMYSITSQPIDVDSLEEVDAMVV